MKIIVPSLGRAGTANSMKWLPEAKRDIIFAVHEDEADAYAKAYPDTEILELSESCRHHTGLVRKEILSQIRNSFIFCDDDIRVSLKTQASISQVFDIIEHHIECGASMAGIAPQLYSGFATTSLINNDAYAVRNRFVATVYGIVPTHFDTCPLDQLPVYEDVALVIHAIQRGGGTITSYVATHSNVSPPKGGCNEWRNKQITIDCLNKLVELYPGICSIRETTSSTHSQQIGIGLRVAWNKIRKL